MALDLIVRGGLLRGREDEGPLDLGVADGRVVVISSRIDDPGTTETGVPLDTSLTVEYTRYLEGVIADGRLHGMRLPHPRGDHEPQPGEDHGARDARQLEETRPVVRQRRERHAE